MPPKREFIPDESNLYRRIPPNQYNEKKGKFSAPAFILRKNEEGLSLNWSKYSTPQKTAKCPRTGKKFYVGALYAKVPRQQELDVIHEPGKKNPSHSLIIGQKLFDCSYEAGEFLAENYKPIITAI